MFSLSPVKKMTYKEYVNKFLTKSEDLFFCDYTISTVFAMNLHIPFSVSKLLESELSRRIVLLEIDYDACKKINKRLKLSNKFLDRKLFSVSTVN